MWIWVISNTNTSLMLLSSMCLHYCGQRGEYSGSICELAIYLQMNQKGKKEKEAK